MINNYFYTNISILLIIIIIYKNIFKYFYTYFFRKEMIRYDPTENDHKEYEINIEKSELETKRDKKKKINKVKVLNENPSIEVSKDLYFSISDSLSKSFKEEGQFSLLNTYRKKIDEEKS